VAIIAAGTILYTEHSHTGQHKEVKNSDTTPVDSSKAVKATPRRHYNNWKMCFNYGFDTPSWYGSNTFTMEYCKHTRKEEYNHNN
jgi:hypothetical protein